MTDYPPVMTTAQAAKYCGYQTTGALRKAKYLGKVAALGRRGGTGSLMWRREALDAFLAGQPAAAGRRT